MDGKENWNILFSRPIRYIRKENILWMEKKQILVIYVISFAILLLVYYRLI